MEEEDNLLDKTYFEKYTKGDIEAAKKFLEELRQGKIKDKFDKDK